MNPTPTTQENIREIKQKELYKMEIIQQKLEELEYTLQDLQDSLNEAMTLRREVETVIDLYITKMKK
jgi:hypothetical protein